MNPYKVYGKRPINDHKVETTKEPKQQRVETPVKILIQRKYKHFDEKRPLQTEILNTTCFDLKGEVVKSSFSSQEGKETYK